MTPRANTSRSRPRADGFTLLEMTLALLLASFVLLTALSLFSMVDRVESSLAARAKDMREFARCHATLRRAIQSLVAAAADGGPARRVGVPANPQPDLEAAKRPPAENPESDDAEKTDDPKKVLLANQHMQLGPLDPNMKFGPDDSVPWRLEMVLSSQPFNFMPVHDGAIRGAFDKIPDLDWTPDDASWQLVWTPLDPPGEPVLVAGHLKEVFMSVLEHEGGWTDTFNARQQNEFPRAVRVVLFARSGATTDWLFEPGVTVGDAPGETHTPTTVSGQTDGASSKEPTGKLDDANMSGDSKGAKKEPSPDTKKSGQPKRGTGTNVRGGGG